MSKKRVRKPAAKATTETILTLKVPKPAAVEITFHGMCGLLASAACMLMPNRDLNDDSGVCDHCGHEMQDGAMTHVMPHQTRLVLSIKSGVLNQAATTWLPDEVVTVDQDELGIWNLDGLDVQVVTDQPPSPTLTGPVKGQPAQPEMLNLGRVHPESVTRPDWAQVAGCARVYLHGGQISGAGKTEFVSAGNYSGKSIASYFSWSSGPVNRFAISNGNRRIVLAMNTGQGSAKISITNAAVTPGAHFSILYSLLKSFAPPMISPVEGKLTETYPSDSCKPTAQLPEP